MTDKATRSYAKDQPAAHWQKWALAAILVCALCVRLYGVNWDDGLQFHPDERQLLMVVDDLSFPWPLDLQLLLSADSPWNPDFFSYGSLPVYLLRIAIDVITPIGAWFNYEVEPYLVGRIISALADTLTVFWVYVLGKKLRSANVGLIAAALTALTVLHVQLAHFYTVDTLLTTFLVLLFYLILWASEAPSAKWAALIGVVLGMTMATKLSAAPIGVCIFLGFFLASIEGTGHHFWLRLWQAISLSAMTVLVGIVIFLIIEPYALIDIGAFIIDVTFESGMASGLIDVPYTRQFLGTTAYWYQLQQAVVWSTGIALGLAALVGGIGEAIAALRDWRREHTFEVGTIILFAWTLIYFAIIGRMQARFLRYMLPIFPVWSIWAAMLIERCLKQRGHWHTAGGALLVLVLSGSGLYTCAYLGIYDEPHTWVQTSLWFSEDAPRGSIVICEAWDDNLPVTRVDGWDTTKWVQWISFDSYGVDSEEKMAELAEKLASADYVILSSQRLYATITRLSERYPLTTNYYQQLFAEQLGYELVYTASSYPSLFGLDLINDTFVGTDLALPELIEQEHQNGLVIGRADESYDVYDHPMALVFANTGYFTADALYDLLMAGESAD